MNHYYFLLFNFWLISATELVSEKTEVLNRTPLILAKKDGHYHYPYQAYITNDQTQEYYFSKKHDGRYFCPLEKNEENKNLLGDIKYSKVREYKYCLFERSFKKEEKKMCPGEVKPLIVEKRDDKGQAECGNDGFLYKFIYEICFEKTTLTKAWYRLRGKEPSRKDVFKDVRHLRVYKVCYNHSDVGDNPRAVLFTEHEIRSPYILRNLKLTEEREMHDFSQPYSTEHYGLANLKKRLTMIMTAYDAERKGRNKFLQQILVPMEDFALGHWMRTTLHILNYSPQDKDLQPLWNAINDHVRYRLIKLYDTIGDVKIFTGTWGQYEDEKGNKIYVGDATEAKISIPLYWWKLLYASEEKQALVIIMHNLPNLTRICGKEENVCNVKEWKPVSQLEDQHNGFVYCCKMSSAKAEIKTLDDLGVEVVKGILELD